MGCGTKSESMNESKHERMNKWTSGRTKKSASALQRRVL